MQLIEWTDDKGYKHLASIIEGQKPEHGIPNDPPNINSLDWDEIKRELHNTLVDRRILSWLDVQTQGGLQTIIISLLKRRLITLYKLEDK